MSGFPDLYRVVSTFENAYLKASDAAEISKYGEDLSIQDVQGTLVEELEVTWFCDASVDMRFEESVYRNAFLDSSEVELLSPQTLAVDELLTASQAHNLLEYLRDEFGGVGSTHEVRTPDFPFTSNYVGLSGRPVGGKARFWLLPERSDYPLSFDAWGYYDLRNHETIKGMDEN